MNHSPLESVHRSLDAKLIDFGGWEMPLSYPNGTISEHQSCRNDAAIFDVSHLGTLAVTGSDSLELLQRCLTNDLTRISPGRAQYTHLLDPDSGEVIDDIIVWWMAPEEFDVIPNASNTGEVQRRLHEAAQGMDVDIVDRTATRAMLAIQGPRARQILASVAPEAADVGRFRIAPFVYKGTECVAAGTGYTGEDGVECAIPAGVAAEFWNDVITAGAKPAGLGARDTLRLEAGFPLHGHDLGGSISTIQAGLSWVVGWDKDDFNGRSTLQAQRDAGGYQKIRGLITPGRRPPREGQPVLNNGVTVGVVTSGNFSPTLGHGIAMALLDSDIEEGQELEIDVRGKPLPATVIKLPFYKAAG